MIAAGLRAIAADQVTHASRAIHLCGINTSRKLCEVPAKTATGATGRLTGHEPLVEAMPTLGIDIDTLVKKVLVLKARLRLGI